MKTLFTLALATLIPAMSFAAGGGAAPVEQDWSFKGITPDWDKEQLLRGYTVATQVCMSCHSFKYISHRNLMKAKFTEADVKALAADMDLGINDKLISQLTAEDAEAVYGKSIPDLSLMNKARGNGADYVFALLTGYEDGVPAKYAHDFESGLPDGGYFNHAFPGHVIAMPQPLNDDQVEYRDGTSATVEQMAKDVTYFMQWTAEPELLARKKLGVYIMLYLFIFTALAYALKRQIWKDVH
jgi:ubiquinol-cytochrome c reductase cytochrome c1 subunit